MGGGGVGISVVNAKSLQNSSSKPRANPTNTQHNRIQNSESKVVIENMDCWSRLTIDDEFEKLVIRMNPPRVTVDNASSRKATLIEVDSANKRGSLLEVVQVLTDLNLLIRRAYISSDGEWFMDVFHVTDQHGNKLSEDDVAERIQQVGLLNWPPF
ncbi:ACT domain-containing protein ACR5 [Populus alba x Populus x berolinensis]|nr:ACT domain-containing protein ACR5 [Populus alba x Populus x berolinensis]